jgi:hypothetical protein
MSNAGAATGAAQTSAGAADTLKNPLDCSSTGFIRHFRLAGDIRYFL